MGFTVWDLQYRIYSTAFPVSYFQSGIFRASFFRNHIMKDTARRAVIISADSDVSQTPSIPRNAGRTKREASGKIKVCPDEMASEITGRFIAVKNELAAVPIQFTR